MKKYCFLFILQMLNVLSMNFPISRFYPPYIPEEHNREYVPQSLDTQRVLSCRYDNNIYRMNIFLDPNISKIFIFSGKTLGFSPSKEGHPVLTYNFLMCKKPHFDFLHDIAEGVYEKLISLNKQLSSFKEVEKVFEDVKSKVPESKYYTINLMELDLDRKKLVDDYDSDDEEDKKKFDSLNIFHGDLKVCFSNKDESGKLGQDFRNKSLNKKYEFEEEIVPFYFNIITLKKK